MEENKNAWYLIDEVEKLDSPALVVYPDRVKRNIQTAISMAGSVQRLRPHVKTHKSAEVIQLMMAAGIAKFKCATIAEAEMLGICRAQDVLLAYQPIGPKLDRLVSLIQKYPATKFSCLVDNMTAAENIAGTANLNALSISVFIDLNLGQNRTGIEPGAPALQLYIECLRRAGIRMTGLHVYDGHIRDKDWNLRKKRCDEAFMQVEAMKNEIINNHLPEPVIVAGGSPTFSIHSKRKNIESSPGTFVYWDKGYSDLCPEQDFVPAALVITRVISIPAPKKLCLDLGHKSVAAENELDRRVYFLNAPELNAVSQSEEHLVVESSVNSYKIGDLFYGLPYHICPTISLYERAFTVEGYHINGEWEVTARDRKINV